MSEKKHSARPLSELDKASRENIERITGLSPLDMNVHDRGFMIARRDYLTSDQIADYVENPDLPPLEDPEEEGSKYEAMTVAELKEEMTKRGVTATGTKKADLVAALEADDAAE